MGFFFFFGSEIHISFEIGIKFDEAFISVDILVVIEIYKRNNIRQKKREISTKLEMPTLSAF